MIPMTVKEIVVASGGRPGPGLDQDAEIDLIVIDSREARPGALFAALPGATADGHDYVEDALAHGATAVLVREDAAARDRAIIAPDALAALGAIAAAARDRLQAQVIAITGSSGKTGTKDLTAAAVGSVKRVVASPASFNDELGVPRTILAADAATEVLVAEVGARGPGHIAALMPVIRPDVGVVTNVGSAHLGMFGSVEATAAAKGELIEAVGGGTAVLNADDPRVRAMAERTNGRVVLYGLGADAEVRATEVSLDDLARARFALHAGGQTHEVALRVSGEHMVPNALAAAAAALAVGVAPADAARGLATCEPSTWRMQVHAAGRRTVINDAYNANPESTAAALKALVTIARGRPTVAVLGPMLELGEASADAHDRIGRLAVRLGVGALVVVGAEARAIHEAARLEGMFGGESHFVADADAALDVLDAVLAPDAVVLVKASRAAGLERVARTLEERA